MLRVERSTIIDAPIARVWAVLRDFNSHVHWHPIIAESFIENGEPSDRVGCVRNFVLDNGHRLREQLLTLDDDACVSRYCILDATIPLRRYVATVTLKPVTDGDRTWWCWSSTFETPPGQEAQMIDAVGRNTYERGFAALRDWLRDDPYAGRSTAMRDAARGAPMHAQAIEIDAYGGPERLRLVEAEAPAPGHGEVRLRQTAIGVNYIDVYVRTGLYAHLLAPPGVPGMEAAGTVLDVGPGVTHLLPGDRAAYACLPPGAYTNVRTLSADQVVRLPAHVSDDDAAALMLKGMSAEYLLHETAPVSRGMHVLVHAAAGGLGLLLCQWAAALGAIVIGTVSTEAKARVAREHGCMHPIVTRDYTFADAVRDITGGRGADVIYDGLGDAARDENLDALALCGRWVSLGQASGPLAPIAPERLSTKSASLSRPVLFHYTRDPVVMRARAERVFAALRDGRLRSVVHHRYPLAAAGEAHRALEGRSTTGAIVLVA